MYILSKCVMRVVVQRVARASSLINEEEVSSIAYGLLILLGVTNQDGEKEIDYLVKKIVNLRIFNDDQGVMNCSLLDVGEALVVSQFTLYARTRKGNRPSYIDAAKGEISEPIYEAFCMELEKQLGMPIGRGVFGADMAVSLVNDGPVTIIIDTNE